MLTMSLAAFASWRDTEIREICEKKCPDLIN